MALAKMGIEAVMDVAGFQRGAKAYDSQLAKSSSATTKAAGQFDKDLTKIQTKSASVFGKMATIAGGILGAQVIGKALGAVKTFLTGTIQVGSDATEMLGKFGVTFGSMTDNLTSDINAIAKATGRSRYDLQGMAADFGAVTKGMGFSEEASAALAGEMVQLSIDVGSFMNVQSPEVMQKIRSALTGETEGLKSLGIVINQDMIKAEALNTGLVATSVDVGKVKTAQLALEAATKRSTAATAKYGAGSIEARKAADAQSKAEANLSKSMEGQTGEISQQAKAMAVRNLIMKATKDAQGDAARTADSWANQMVKLNGVWKDFQTDLGLGLTEGLGPVLQVINRIAGAALPALVTSLSGSVIPAIGKFASKMVETIDAIEIGWAEGSGVLGKAVGIFTNVMGSVLGKPLPETMIDSMWKFVRDVNKIKAQLAESFASQPTLAGGAAVFMQAIGIPQDIRSRVFKVLDPLEKGIKQRILKIRAAVMLSYGTTDAATRLMAAIGIPVNITSRVKALFDPIEKAIRSALKKVGDVVGKVKIGGEEGGIGGAMSALFGAVPDLTEAFNSVKTAILTAASTALAGLWTTFAAANPDLANPLEQIFKGATAEGGPDWGMMLGGLEALGTTLLEKLTPIVQTAWDNIWKNIKTVEIPFTGGMTIGEAFDTLKLKIADAKIAVGEIALKVEDFVNTTLVPILAGTGVAALAAFGAIIYTMVIPALIAQAAAGWAAIAPLLPMIATVAAIGVAVGLLTAAWINDWGGVRTFMTDLWTNTLEPAFNSLVSWFQTTIPLAIATVSGFWTNTLLPAITGVWDFLSTYIIPIFTSIAEIHMIAINLALTAMAGLWQNVLLPALTSVWEFLTNSILVIFEAVGGYLSDTFGPAIETLSGLWTNTLLPALRDIWSFISDKLIPKFDGVGTALDGIKKALGGVVAWFGKAKDAAASVELPPVLTPGSPTPFELGLRGIAAAFGPVVDEMLSFAKSISGPQAAAMKNVASAFKDMAKGIDKMAGALSKIGEFQGTGGSIGGFGTWLDQFAEVAMMAASKIETIIEVIGYNRIHKLKLTAGRLNEVIRTVLVDLSAIKERQLPNLEVWFNQLQDVFQRAVVVMNAIYGKWGMAVLTRAAEVAGLVGQVLQILGEDLGKAVPPPPDYESILDAFLGGLEMAMNKIMPKLSDIWAFFGGPVLNEAVKTVAAISEIVGILSLASVLEGVVKAKTALEQDFGPLMDLVMVALRVAVDAIVPMLLDVQDRWGEALEAVDGVAGKMDEVLGVLGVDLAKIIPPPVNFPALLGGFLAALVMGVNALVPMLRDVRAQIGGTVIDEAALTAKALADIIGILSLADVFAGLSKPENAIKNNFTKMVQKVLDALTSAVDILIPGLQSINAKWGGVLEEVVKIAQSMASVFGGINDAQTAALEFSKSGNLDLGAFTRKIATLNAATAAAVSGLVAPAVPAPAIVGAAPGTTPVRSGAVNGNVNVSTGPVVVNIYGVGGNLLQTYTQSTNAAGQVDIRLAEGMSTG